MLINMNNPINKLLKLGRQIRGFFPSALPVGVSEFNAWAESLAATYDLPTKDEDSVKYTLATMLMHLGPNVAYRSNFAFFLYFRAAASKQVAGACFYEIKQRQKEAEEKAKQQALPNATG